MERPNAAEILDSGFDLWSDLSGSDPLDRHPLSAVLSRIGQEKIELFEADQMNNGLAVITAGPLVLRRPNEQPLVPSKLALRL